jgi:acetylglutamate/LysW-gamma-L-alpha-aminoadipate kinase
MILLKIGGGKGINLDFICSDVAALIAKGEQIVIVHGASATRDEIAEKLGTPTKTITSPSGVSSVYTDEAAMDVFLMVYAGLLNKKIVAALQAHGVNAVGLSGVDGRLWEAKRKEAVYAVEGEKTLLITDNLTGKVQHVNAGLIALLANAGYVPVICPPAISLDQKIVNTDNDFATAVMAEALNIKDMVVLFEAPGLLREFKDPTSLIREIKKEELENYLPYTQGRMMKKLLGTKDAFARGVERVYWSDGRIEQPIQNALKGTGTVIK